MQEYEFTLRVVTPAGGTLVTVPGLLLPALPDIPDYVPPPLATVVQVGPGRHLARWRSPGASSG